MIFFGSKKEKNITIQEVKALYAKGNYKAALSSCKKYLEQEKNDFDATNLLGDIYYKMGDKTKSLEIFKQLAASMEEDKYVDRAIAVTKKIIRLFPEQYDMYRKLSKLFEKKNIKAEQLDVLYDLADIYEKKGLDDKAIDILKEIAEIDRNSILNYKRIIKKLQQFGKKYDICKFMHYCVELAHKNNDSEALQFFCEAAIESECEFKSYLKYTVDYFRKNSEKNDIFVKYAEEFLLEEFDREVFSYYLTLKPLESNLQFYNKIKSKYRAYDIYLPILSYLLDFDLNEFKLEINEIVNLPEYDFKENLPKLAEVFYDKVNDPEILDMLVVLASKGSMKELQLNIYKKLTDIYKELGDTVKANNIEKYINELTYSATDSDQKSNDIELGATYDSFAEGENILNIDTDTDFGDIDLELTSFDTSDEKVALDLDLDTKDNDTLELELNKNTVDDSSIDIDIDFSQPEEVNDIELSKEDIELSKDDVDIEINLDEFGVNDETEIGDIFDNVDDVELKRDDTTDYPEEDNFAKQIEYVKSLIKNKKYQEARTEVDQLIILYPDNEIIKNIAAELILAETDFASDKNDKKTDISEIVTYEFKSIANNIRASINEQVSEDDYETHYDLAIAYMEMELFEDAVNELKKSATGAKKYESLFLLAECYKRMGLLDDAVNVHKLIVVDYEEKEKLLNSLYEIGLLLEMKNDPVTAINYFEKVYRLDPNFRDIKDKYNASTDISFEENRGGDEKKKKKKISFL
ncbi:tetratricopeptide repeat protein [Deferribacterales bacterium Es71-Z0220]|uniref:tetratricopeptide repeat protein n=1 Tax=Deferrivibrio essentukiensis TaxID=2880922 RepID=UPI001F61266E|nr:tetratricopeptide repeat protein [Deferrivibrio essentukiensis]MCB4204144.1 tetratricopeptide repeat protein [Deferrivibrio essentukiensis]